MILGNHQQISQGGNRMTKEEYIRKINEDHEWAPGWDVIETEFSRLYPGQKPAHFGSRTPTKFQFKNF